MIKNKVIWSESTVDYNTKMAEMQWRQSTPKATCFSSSQLWIYQWHGLLNTCILLVGMVIGLEGVGGNV